jgi:uncharacterized protein YfaS (alpha-2-macroglobulin family)
MKNVFKPLLALLAIAVIISCVPNRNKISNVDKIRFEGLISGNTSGMISSTAPIRVVVGKLVKNYQPGSELPENLFAFSPRVAGKTFLADEHTLEFRPEKPLKSGTAYEVEFLLGKILEVESDLKVYNFGFSVISQDFKVYHGNLYSTGRDEDFLKRYEGKLVTADQMIAEDAAKLLSVSSPHEKLNVKIEAAGQGTFTYIIDSIRRKEDSYKISLNWNGSPLNIDQKGSFDIEIPSVNEFSFLNIEVSQDAGNQFIQLHFSDPLDADQSLAGLIRIDGYEDIKIRKSGSTVTLYPQTRLTGERTIQVDASLRNGRGKTLGTNQTLVVSLEALKPAVTIIGNGVIMPDSRNLSLPFKTVSLRAVDITVYKIFAGNLKQYFQFNFYDGDQYLKYLGRPVYRKTMMLDENTNVDLKQWNAFSIDLSGMFVQDPQAIYRVKFSFKKQYSLYDCGDSQVSDITAFKESESFDEAELSTWDNGEYYFDYDWPEDYNWEQRDNPCSSSYYMSNRFPQRNLLASNLGIISKSADNREFVVAVTDLLTTAPVSGAKVEFYNFQQQPLGDGLTGSDGILRIKLDNVPYLLSAKSDKQQSWLRLDDGNSLSVSNFDVSGEKIQKGIKGLIYGERGVWRPGDTLFLTFVMDDTKKKLPENHPVVLELYNSRGQMAGRQVKNAGTHGFYPFTITTDASAPTGNWRATVNVGGSVFEKLIKIETVKPNRLKINLDFGRKVLLANQKDQEGLLKVKWLHGADANGLKALVNVKLVNAPAAFKGYEKYTFSDPSRYYYPAEYAVFDSRLNNTGEARFPLNLEVNSNAPGMLNAIFNTRITEEGGDFSTDVFSVPLAPYKRFVGISVPNGGTMNKMLTTDTSQLINVVTVDENGNPVSANNLDVIIYKVDWRWWWSSGDDNMANWTSGENSSIVMRKTISTVNGKGSLSFRINHPDWGRYFISILDPEQGHSAGLSVYMDWPSYINRNGRTNPAGATMLSLSADKEKYQPGEKATVSFPSSDGSRALLSIESGSNILKTWWIDCNAGETNYSFDITPDMAPNVYAYLTLLQPHAQTLNDLPIRTFGVVPIFVVDEETKIEPVIKLPTETRPNSNYLVKISEKNGRAMTYTLAVVDEGLLDLTRFKTPDPWKVFFAREALGVKTWDLFDDVLGAYGGHLQKVLAIGGDEGLLNKGAKKASRFKPVVTYLGPFTLAKKKTAEHNLKMTDYVGSVRVMVIAGNEGAWGSAEANMPVKQPLMVLPTAPRVLGPAEDFDLPVSIFAMNDNIREVEISISVEGAIKSPETSRQTITFEKAAEKMAYFKMKAGDMAGTGKISVNAKSGNETASASISIEVRNPNPLTTKTTTSILEAGESRDINYSFHGIKGSNSGKITVSGLPSFDLQKNLDYLISYPYGCVEQITSSAFPQLFLSQLTTLSESQEMEVSKNIRNAIRQLARFQTSGGGLSYWPGGNYLSEWGTSYAGHFMILAEQKGFLVPFDVKKKWLDWQYKTASNYDDTKYDYWDRSDFLQAYRLYTLALAGQANISAMNRLRENPKITADARWRLAAAYLLAGKPEAAKELIRNIPQNATFTYDNPGATFGSSLRDQAMILETLILLKQENEAFELLVDIADQMKNTSLNTQSAAFCLYAFARFAETSKMEKGVKINYRADGKSENVESGKAVYQILLNENNASGGVATIKNTGNSKLFVTTTLTGQPLEGSEDSEARNLDISIKYLSQQGTLMNIAEIVQGTDFTAEVTVRNPGRLGIYQNLALNQVLPSGWEILNMRVNDELVIKKEAAYTYRDIRDDRVYTFFDLEPNQSVTYRVFLNAAYTGRFYLPAVSCEAMYDSRIYARQKGQWVVVKK